MARELLFIAGRRRLQDEVPGRIKGFRLGKGFALQSELVRNGLGEDSQAVEAQPLGQAGQVGIHDRGGTAFLAFVWHQHSFA